VGVVCPQQPLMTSSWVGTRKIGFPYFEKIDVLDERFDDSCKSLLEAIERFLLLLPDKQKIMDSPSD
jgi:hypothetical protein